MMKKMFLDCQELYTDPNQIVNRGEFIKCFSNRKWSVRDLILYRISEHLEDVPAPIIVDLGCGNGSFLHKLNQATEGEGILIGYDVIMQPNIKKIEREKNVSFYLIDKKDQSNPPAHVPSWDVLLMMNMAYHLSDPLTYIRKLIKQRKKLNNNSWLLIITTKYEQNFEGMQEVHNNLCKKLSCEDDLVEHHYYNFSGDFAEISLGKLEGVSLHKDKLSTTLWVNSPEMWLKYYRSTSKYRYYCQHIKGYEKALLDYFHDKMNFPMTDVLNEALFILKPLPDAGQ